MKYGTPNLANLILVYKFNVYGIGTGMQISYFNRYNVKTPFLFHSVN